MSMNSLKLSTSFREAQQLQDLAKPNLPRRGVRTTEENVAIRARTIGADVARATRNGRNEGKPAPAYALVLENMKEHIVPYSLRVCLCGLGLELQANDHLQIYLQ